MNRLSLILLLYWSPGVFYSLAGKTVNPPKFVDINNEYLQYSKDDTLNITCSGDQPLVWKLPEYVTHDGRQSKKSWKTDEVHFTQLVIRNLNYTDTGRYYCHFEETTNQSTGSTTRNIYVYVSDSENMIFVPRNQTKPRRIYYIYQASDSEIPFLATRPDVNVILQKKMGRNWTQVNSSENPQDYDPTRGFIIHRGSNFFNNVFSCNATIPGSDHSTIIEFVLMWLQETIAPAPKIDDSLVRSVEVGQSFTLKCNATVTSGTRAIAEWITPGPVNNSLATPALIRRVSRVSRLSEIFSTLEVRSAQKEDEGLYTCILIDHNRKNGSTSAYITVHELEQQPRIINTNMNGTTVTVDIGDEFIFFCKASGKPTPNITWYKNEEILDSGIPWLDFRDNNEIMAIRRVKDADKGTYKCDASNSKGKSSTNLTIKIQGSTSSSTGRDLEEILSEVKSYIKFALNMFNK